MILDSIVALLALLFAPVAAVASAVFIPIINLFLGLLEMIVSIFVSDFSVRRLKRKESGSVWTPSTILSGLCLLLLLGLIAWLFVTPMIKNRTITLVAEDGHSLPFAAVIVSIRDTEHHDRSDKSGKLKIPRFSTDSVTIKDPRYVEETWSAEEIGDQLVVSRTLLGSGLDQFADKLIQPAKR